MDRYSHASSSEAYYYQLWGKECPNKKVLPAVRIRLKLEAESFKRLKEVVRPSFVRRSLLIELLRRGIRPTPSALFRRACVARTFPGRKQSNFCPVKTLPLVVRLI